MAERTVTLAILVNIVAPYRIPIYRRLAHAFRTHVVYSGVETDRPTWQTPADSNNLSYRRASGFTAHRRRQSRQGLYGLRHLHVNPGYAVELLRIRPDAVISIEMGFRTLMAMLYGMFFRKPIWVWWGGTCHTERVAGRARRVARAAFARWVRHWISYGDEATAYLRTIGVPRERILQIQNCVDEELYQQPGEPYYRLEPRPTLLYVGQLIERKGLRELLQTSARLIAEGRRFTLLIVGDGPEREQLQELARDLGLWNIHFAPGHPPERMPGVYRSADLLVLPTLEDVWGLVVNEALWSGLPVLCSRYAGSADELLPPACVFDPLDQGDFLSAMRRALDGRLSGIDHRRLVRCQAVADALVTDIRRVLAAGTGGPTMGARLQDALRAAASRLPHRAPD